MHAKIIMTLNYCKIKIKQKRESRLFLFLKQTIAFKHFTRDYNPIQKKKKKR